MSTALHQGAVNTHRVRNLRDVVNAGVLYDTVTLGAINTGFKACGALCFILLSAVEYPLDHNRHHQMGAPYQSLVTRQLLVK